MIVTDMVFIRATAEGLVLEEIAEEVTVEEVVNATQAPLHGAENLGRVSHPDPRGRTPLRLSRCERLDTRHPI